MQTFLTPHVGAVNDLTARWCAAAGDDDFVVSGAGLWPLLALLAAAADGPARSELEAAVGLPAEAAQEAALRTLDVLAGAVDLSAALGIWIRKDLPLHDDWLGALPVGTVDLLTGQPALDEWARRHTNGLIEQFPLHVTPSTLLVLATALAAKTSWRQPFHNAVLSPETGPWRGRRLTARAGWPWSRAGSPTPPTLHRRVRRPYRFPDSGGDRDRGVRGLSRLSRGRRAGVAPAR
ncbi:serpin family protein [Nocardia lijiangensis]|uniref:serpin family protein n=1 Tax=Nocardia lijiangensis TaxID=299618 RepID=UPI0008331834|nr:serpin family protein [Nocardia lijiangensis]